MKTFWIVVVPLGILLQVGIGLWNVLAGNEIGYVNLFIAAVVTYGMYLTWRRQ